MKTDIQKLLDAITPDVLGVFWLTSTELHTRPRPFDALNYVLNGLLSEYCHNKDIIEKDEKTLNVNSDSKYKNFFSSNNYGAPFFVAHLKENVSLVEQDFINLMTLAQTLKKQNKTTILYIDLIPTNNLTILRKKYSNFNFVSLIFE